MIFKSQRNNFLPEYLYIHHKIFFITFKKCVDHDHAGQMFGLSNKNYSKPWKARTPKYTKTK